MGTTQAIPASALPVYSIFHEPPCSGPRALLVAMSFTGGVGSYSLDYSNQQRTGKLENVQCVYIDASQTDVPVSVTFGTGQTITAKGRTQGYYPCLSADPFRCTISNPLSNANVIAMFLNFSVQPAQWASQ
jgi:hypothetical protein